jgi:hypothetical protein
MQVKKSELFSYEKFPSEGLVAYFSMEIAINPGHAHLLGRPGRSGRGYVCVPPRIWEFHLLPSR